MIIKNFTIHKNEKVTRIKVPQSIIADAQISLNEKEDIVLLHTMHQTISKPFHLNDRIYEKLETERDKRNIRYKGFSKEAVNKHRNHLMELGYITILYRRTKDGRFDGLDYHIHNEPVNANNYNNISVPDRTGYVTNTTTFDKVTDTNYIQVPVDVINMDLNHGTLGLYAIMLIWANNPNHVITKASLMRYCKDGETKINRCLKELIEIGLVKGQMVGRRKIYAVTDIPFEFDEVEETENNDTEVANIKRIVYNMKPNEATTDIEENKSSNYFIMKPLKSIDTNYSINQTCMEVKKRLDLPTRPMKEVTQNAVMTRVEHTKIDELIEAYNDAMGHDFLWSKDNKAKLLEIYNIHGEGRIIKAIDKVKNTEWLRQHNTPIHFIKKFENICNGEYDKFICNTYNEMPTRDNSNFSFADTSIDTSTPKYPSFSNDDLEDYVLSKQYDFDYDKMTADRRLHGSADYIKYVLINKSGEEIKAYLGEHPEVEQQILSNTKRPIQSHIEANRGTSYKPSHESTGMSSIREADSGIFKMIKNHASPNAIPVPDTDTKAKTDEPLTPEQQAKDNHIASMSAKIRESMKSLLEPSAADIDTSANELKSNSFTFDEPEAVPLTADIDTSPNEPVAEEQPLVYPLDPDELEEIVKIPDNDIDDFDTDLLDESTREKWDNLCMDYDFSIRDINKYCNVTYIDFNEDTFILEIEYIQYICTIKDRTT